MLLVSMPFSSAQQPNLGLSLLAAGLRARGHACDVRYFSLDYAGHVGVDRFALIAHERLYHAFIGEWVFADRVHPRDDFEDFEYLATVLREFCEDDEWLALTHEVIEARKQAGPFLERCYDAVDWRQYRIVGFSTSFQQTMASLGLAALVKERHPEIDIVFGGANCEAELGLQLIESYAAIDAVCLGEGDIAFPDFVEARFAGEDGADIPAMAVRRGGQILRPAQDSNPVADMDALPRPDFEDYFRQHGAVAGLDRAFPPVATFETARGCWWGAKHHCTFCGLNGKTMAFRSKSQDRAYDEIMALCDRYGEDLVAVDNILDMSYLTALLPRLAESERRITMHFEVKANLSPAQLSLMSQAGLKKIQPGIETLDTDVLRLMRKGSSMLRNVQLLKLAAECGIYVEWGFLYGFPGEQPEQYRQMAALIPRIMHLQPPSGFVRVRADRFSPYFKDPAAFGIEIEPMPAYRFIYPYRDDLLERHAYHFRIRSPGLDDAEGYADETAHAVRAWIAQAAETELYAVEGTDGLTVRRKRAAGDGQTLVLDDLAGAIVHACATIQPEHRLTAALADRWSTGAVQDALKALVRQGLILSEGSNYLTLVLRQPGYRNAPSWNEIRSAQITPHALAAPQGYC